MSTKEIFTTVSATGHAETAFKSVSFNVSTVSSDKDNASARAKADQVLNTVMAAIKELNKRSAEIDMKRLKCNYDTQPWMEYDQKAREQKHLGYVVTGRVTCSTERVDAATVIMDALTKIEGATVQRPVFSADDTAEARSAAFMAAYNRAFEDFNLQCAVLGVDPDDYEIVRYSPTAETMRPGGDGAFIGSVSVSADAPMAAPAEIKAGRAETTAYVQLTYAKKAATGRAKPQTRASSGTGKTRSGRETTSEDLT